MVTAVLKQRLALWVQLLHHDIRCLLATHMSVNFQVSRHDSLEHSTAALGLLRLREQCSGSSKAACKGDKEA